MNNWQDLKLNELEPHISKFFTNKKNRQRIDSFIEHVLKEGMYSNDRKWTYPKNLEDMVNCANYWYYVRNVGMKTVSLMRDFINYVAEKNVFDNIKFHRFLRSKEFMEKRKNDKIKNWRDREAKAYEMRGKGMKWSEIADKFDCTIAGAIQMERRHRKNNDLPRHVHDFYSEKVKSLKTQYEELKEDIMLIADYLREKGHHNIAYVVEERIKNGRFKK